MQRPPNGNGGSNRCYNPYENFRPRHNTGLDRNAGQQGQRQRVYNVLRAHLNDLWKNAANNATNNDVGQQNNQGPNTGGWRDAWRSHLGQEFDVAMLSQMTGSWVVGNYLADWAYKNGTVNNKKLLGAYALADMYGTSRRESQSAQQKPSDEVGAFLEFLKGKKDEEKTVVKEPANDDDLSGFDPGNVTWDG